MKYKVSYYKKELEHGMDSGFRQMTFTTKAGAVAFVDAALYGAEDVSIRVIDDVEVPAAV